MSRAIRRRGSRSKIALRATGQDPVRRTAWRRALHGDDPAELVFTVAMTVEGAMNRFGFDVLVERILVPSLRPGQVVIWDNLNVHRRADAQCLIATRACQLLWLPPYSPDLTPIEQAFSTCTTGLR